MTLGGLAIAIGELVDDAVVGGENTLRRLKENGALTAAPSRSLDVIARANQEVRSGVFYATVIIVLVFVPLFALSGIEGRLFVPLGIAYIVSILASLAASITLTPVLAYYFLSTPKGHGSGDSLLCPHAQVRQREALAGWHSAVPALFPCRLDEEWRARARRCPASAYVSAAVQRRHDCRQPALQSRHLACQVEPLGRRRRAPHHGDSGGQERRAVAPAAGSSTSTPKVWHHTEIDVDLSRSAREKEDIYAHVRSKSAVLPVFDSHRSTDRPPSETISFREFGPRSSSRSSATISTRLRSSRELIRARAARRSRGRRICRSRSRCSSRSSR